MAKGKKKQSHERAQGLSDLAWLLLQAMATEPLRIEYNTRVLGGSFKEEDVGRLDAAYDELEEHGLIEKSGSVVSFFSTPKSLHRITDKGIARAGKAA